MQTEKQKESALEAEALTAEWLAEATPSEIDEAWAAAVLPSRRLFERANENTAKAVKYRKWGGRYAAQADGYDQAATELYQRAREAREAVEGPYKAEWDKRGGWSRAYIVPDGHIHKTTACHSLHPTTLIGWLPELSGHDEAEIVAHAGVNACTFCYPSAPVEELRAAERAAKAAAECPGSRQFASGVSGGRRYGTCPECGQSVSITSRHSFRAHKPKAAA